MSFLLRLHQLFCMLLLLAVVGCAALNPYDNEVYCKAKYEGGQCLDVIAAYNQAVDADKIPSRTARGTGEGALEGQQPSVFDPTDPGGISTGTSVKELRNLEPRLAYLAARQKRLTALLKDPVTPMLAPPKVMRVLILPYTTTKQGSEMLLMSRFVYVKVEDSSFILGDALDSVPQ